MHAPGKRVSEDTEILLGVSGFKPVKSVKLLGVTIDRFLTFGPHIDTVVSKCNSLLGMLGRASSLLPTQLLRTAYVSLIRSHAEYCSAVWASAASTHLHKVDVIQKRASRILLHAHRDAHSEPLQRILKLDSLELRRQKHICKIVQRCIDDNYNPVLDNLFSLNNNDGKLLYDNKSRINIGKRRFENFAAEIYMKLWT